MKNLNFLLLATLFIPLTFSCSDDDDDSQDISVPTNFFEAHNGVWVTSFSDGSQSLYDIYDSGWDTYSRLTNSGCWSSSPSAGGSTTIVSNTPDELLAESINIPASSIFSGDDLQLLSDAGFSTISVDQAYLDNTSTLISFAQVIYAGTFEVELLTISGNLGKQSSTSYDTCKFASENIIHNISMEGKGKLKHQTIMQIKK
tara:strand:- start:5143 stop:5745 length:603 start_codon:yes stop_codon:yes gene_type:complete